MERTIPYITLSGRILLALIFVTAGYSKIGGYDGTLQYMQAFNVPAFLLPLVIFAELGGGIALIAGFLTRTAAAGLAIFSVVAAMIFHSNFADQMQSILFMKNIAMAGGLLYIVAFGAGKFSVDDKLGLKF
ncbi:MAG: DoxX family protein [Gammaproteobacteria bacterium]|jgi:putative oxidoreductase|nr:DoxX family protein [Gammaproteobacteria bacterium]MBQ0774833.1 DoxX family protein [Gammaproteobacteria bacterium]